MRLKYRYKLVIFLGIVILSLLGRSLPTIAAWPAAASPFVGLCALFGALRQPIQTPSPETLLGAVLAAMALVPCLLRRRFHCQTTCPLGFCFDIIRKARKATTKTRGFSFRFLPKLGVFLAVFTGIACAFDAVGFLWLDPFILFGSAFRGTTPLLFVLLFALVFVWFAPSVWCRRLCPLGGTQDLLYDSKKLLRKIARPTAATATMPNLSRRNIVLRSFIWLAAGALGLRFLRPSVEASTDTETIRPPGCVPEPSFSSLCSRCGICVQQCPTKLLKTTPIRSGLLDLGTPRVEYESAWCRDDCVACTRVCPTGALRPLSLPEKKEFKMGLAVLNFETCLLYEDVECAICGRECPFDAISYQWSEEEYRQVPVIDADKCTGCGRCAVMCPVKEGKPLTVKALKPMKTRL